MPPTHLIIVCGHAIWTGGPANGHDESEWLIEAYKKGETPTFIEHIKAGLRELSQDQNAILIFSGGPTRSETRLSEAKSYCNLAVANSYFGYDIPDASQRIMVEERALDSYYNILFSMVEFWRGWGVWPNIITIVSHGFKRDRMVEGHCAAIGFPGERVRFVGINPPGLEGEEKAGVMGGVQLAMGQWEGDPHGVGEELAGKRRGRNCWGVGQRLFLGEEERARARVLTRILEDGGEVLVDGVRPWGR